MIIAGLRPREYATLRAQLARRAAEPGRGSPDGVGAPEAIADLLPDDAAQTEVSAVDIAPRPPSD